MQVQLAAAASTEFESTSIQLSLENEKVEKAVGLYVKALEGVVDGKGDVLGFAFAINGELNCADIYAAPSLFRALYPKLLRACAVEAVASPKNGDSSNPLPDGTAVQAWLADVEEGDTTRTDLSERMQLTTRETETDVFWESQDQGQWLHRRYLRK